MATKRTAGDNTTPESSDEARQAEGLQGSEGETDTTMAQAFREATGEEGEAEVERRPRARGRRRSMMREDLDYEMSDELVEDVSAVTTAAVVGVAAAVIEAELIPGILIGAGALIVGKMFPRLVRGMRPVAKTLIRTGLALTDRTREVMSETGEQFQDMVAEVRAERDESAEMKGRTRGRRAAQAEAAA